MKKQELFNKIINGVSKKIYNVLDESEVEDIFDLSKIDKAKLDFLSRVPLKAIAGGMIYGEPFSLDEDYNFIGDNLNKTYSYEEIIQLAPGKLGLDKDFFKTRISHSIFANNIDTIILALDIFDNVDFIISSMKYFGWTISSKREFKYDNYALTILYFDPEFQNDVNDEVKQNFILSHWTPTYNYNSIMQNGLMPKSDNYKYEYPPKIHLMKGTIDDTNKISLGKQLCRHNKNPKNDGKYTLLNVNTELIPYKIDFYYDPRYEFGYYTKEAICKEAISKIDEYDFKE